MPAKKVLQSDKLRRPEVEIGAASSIDRATFELSSRRTGMSFQRTRLSADRTLMSVIRTALSLITFGFTIYQFFTHLNESNILQGAKIAAGKFGIALLVIGTGMLILGIVYHLQFMRGLRGMRQEMTHGGLIHGQSGFPVSLTLIAAVLLLLVGLVAISSITFNLGPFD